MNIFSKSKPTKRVTIALGPTISRQASPNQLPGQSLSRQTTPNANGQLARKISRQTTPNSHNPPKPSLTTDYLYNNHLPNNTDESFVKRQFYRELRKSEFAKKVHKGYQETKKGIQEHSKWFHDWILNAVQYETRPDGSLGSILSYDEVYAISFGWFIPRWGSAFNWYQSVLVCGASILLATLLGYYSCINIESNRCIALPEPSTSYLTLLTLCSFVLAFFINMVVNRWWTVRTTIGSLKTSTEQCMMILVNVLSTEVNDHSSKPRVRINKEINAKKLLKRMAGLLLLSYRTVINNARNVQDIDDLYERNIITQKDFDYFSSLHIMPTDVCVVMMKLLHEAARKGLFLQKHRVSESNMAALSKCLFTIQETSNQVGVLVTVQLPFPFVQLIAAIVYCFIIQLFLVSSSFIASGIKHNNSSSIIIGAITILLYNAILLSMLKLFTVLCNPLRNDVADFPMMTYQNNLEKKLLAMANNAFILDQLVDLDDDETVIDFEEDNESSLGDYFPMQGNSSPTTAKNPSVSSQNNSPMNHNQAQNHQSSPSLEHNVYVSDNNNVLSRMNSVAFSAKNHKFSVNDAPSAFSQNESFGIDRLLSEEIRLDIAPTSRDL